MTGYLVIVNKCPSFNVEFCEEFPVEEYTRDDCTGEYPSRDLTGGKVREAPVEKASGGSQENG